MLVGAAALMTTALSPAPAFADGGQGGGLNDDVVSGGSGYMGDDGADAGNSSMYFGGGGGGAGGGNGGDGSIWHCHSCTVGAGGAGGTDGSPNGQSGGDPIYAGGGGGGGGGWHGNGFTSLLGVTNLVGGRGGDGGDGVFPGGGGGGGAGGYGALITSGTTFGPTSINITGGDGGDGGHALWGYFQGGQGGAGGIGVYIESPGAVFTTSGAITGGEGGRGGNVSDSLPRGAAGGVGGHGIKADSVTIINRGSITGGNGGVYGWADGFSGQNERAEAGSGIFGSNLTIVNGGTISGGYGGWGESTSSITFVTGTNSLTFENATSGLEDYIQLWNDTQLTLNQNNGVDTVIDVDIVGVGSVVKQGTGQVTLNGDATYSGATTVSGGALAINGSVAGAMEVTAGGTLKGTGVLNGDATFSTGGIHAPGNSIGTQTFAGNYSLGYGAILEIEANAAGQSDKVVVQGTVSLTGSILRVMAENGTYNPSTTYVIIDNQGAGAVVGTFAELTSNLAFLTPTMSYTEGDGNDVVLTLTRNGVALGDVAHTPNQAAVAGALSSLPPEDPLNDALMGLSEDQARDALDQLSGEPHAQSQSAATCKPAASS